MSSRSVAVILVLAALAACSKARSIDDEAGGKPISIYAPPSGTLTPVTPLAADASAPVTAETEGEPLQAWMKANANPPTIAKDLAGLALVLDRMSTFAPMGYPNWVSISKDGAAAARSGDLDAAKASCRSCHDQYKQKYKAELHERKI